MKQYPISIQDYADIREGDFFYVDKTAYVYALTRKKSAYFLSRPRRFGKSLLLSTFRCCFEGRRSLFDGLAIAGLEKEWIKRPVISP